MAKKNRDDFSKNTALQIAKRAGWLCSFPQCRVHTAGATADGQDEINIGTAAHICAAAPGGPRYDDKMSKNERSSADNGIWMCRDHGKAIDDEKQFDTPLLREWKRQAQLESWQRVLRNEVAIAPPPPHQRRFDSAPAYRRRARPWGFSQDGEMAVYIGVAHPESG
jgi:hypothetical protein